MYYIICLYYTSFISNLEGINCADICVGKKIDYSLLKYIDYLLISDEDCLEPYSLLQKHTRGKVIVHSSHGSYWDDKKYNLPSEKILKNVNVLGAGDMFAANFMIGLLKENPLHEIIETAHLKTTERIMNG